MHIDAQGNDIRYGWKVTAGPASEPLTIAEAKSYLAAGDGEDALIAALVMTARTKLEKDTGRLGINQTVEYALDAVPGFRAPIYLPVAPVSSVVLKAYDAANAETIVSANSYRIDTHSKPSRLVLNDGYDWPCDLRKTQGLIATITAGYGEAYAAITDGAWMHAVRLLLGHWYDNRSAVEIGTITSTVPFAYAFLIDGLIVPFGRTA